MNTRFKLFASYNILQYLCDFIHVLIFVTVSKCRKSPRLTNIAIICQRSNWTDSYIQCVFTHLKGEANLTAASHWFLCRDPTNNSATMYTKMQRDHARVGKPALISGQNSKVSMRSKLHIMGGHPCGFTETSCVVSYQNVIETWNLSLS